MSTRLTRPRGVIEAGGILDRIVASKAKRLEETKLRLPLARLARSTDGKIRPLAAALSRSERVNIIAEIKQRSPSKGIICEDFDPVRIAKSYEIGDAAALSVLCEEDFFGGSLEHLKAIRGQVELPLLRKDFIFDEYQIYESASAGADAILLIVAILDDELLARLIGLARDVGLEPLVEVHSADEVRRAAQAGASIIGVNNRDLTTFNVDLETSVRMVSVAPIGAILVSESGIHNGQDIRRLKQSGFSAFLVGEHLMRAGNPGDALAQLIAEATA
jgi:indole-3-glycerol phosphate synthase